MKAEIYSIDGVVLGNIELPKVFETVVRDDLIRRAVLSEQSEKKQPKGVMPIAGFQTSAKLRGRKEAYRSLKNKGISRLPREKLPKGRFGRVRMVPSAVGGHRAHPPHPEEILVEKINKREYKKALQCAIAATADEKIVAARGHKFKTVPIVVEEKLESLTKTKEVVNTLKKLSINDDIERAVKTRPRTGRPKTRYGGSKRAKSVLIVVGDSNKPIIKSAKNIAGVDVCSVNDLKVELLAPGTHPGRLTIWTKDAIEALKVM